MGEIHDQHVLSILSSWFGSVLSQETRDMYDDWMIISPRVWFLKFGLMDFRFQGVY